MSIHWRQFLTWPWMVSIISTVILFAVLPYYSGYEATTVPIIYGYFHLFTNFQGDWAHCIFVPFIVFWLVYRDWNKIRPIPLQPANSGIIIILIAMTIYWFGYRASINYFAYPALQLYYMGLIVWFCGWNMFKTVFFYWLFLCFMYPLPALTDQIAVNLRHLMTWCSAGLLNLIGIPVVRMGTGIFSAPDPAKDLAQGALFQLEVADPCSGIRSLSALIMLSALYGYLMMRKAWQKLAILALAIPFAIIGNIARILILTVGTLLFGSDFAIGTLENPTIYHLGAGYAVFLIAIGMMVLTGWLFERPWKRYWQQLTPHATENLPNTPTQTSEDPTRP